jgi:sulfoxide reductase heme-binding subunit YedZ
VILATTAAWYAALAGGLVAFSLLTISVLVGIGLAGQPRLRHWPRFAIEDVHRYAGLLTAAFVGIHGVALLVDDYLPFSALDLVLPGTAPYRPLATALGVVALELLAALALTNRYRKRIPHHVWRRAHDANFAVWLLALVHGVTAGTDAETIWGVGLFAVAGASVAGATVWRLLRSGGFAPWALRLWPGTAALVVGELVVALAFLRTS